MGTVRALDAGTLSITRLLKLMRGADIRSLTDPIAKAEQVAALKNTDARLYRESRKRRR